jgi:hypothetical protein
MHHESTRGGSDPEAVGALLLGGHARHGVPCADLSIPVSLVWLGRGLSRARMVEIDRRKCPPDPLAFFADCAILGRLRGSVEPALDGTDLEGPPIREGAPESQEGAFGHVKTISRSLVSHLSVSVPTARGEAAGRTRLHGPPS